MCDKHLKKRVPFTGRFVRYFYPHGTEQLMLQRYMRELESFIQTAKSHGSQLILIEPPTLLGRLPDIEQFHMALQDTLDGHEIVYHDFSESITDTRFFLNHDHLNDAGVQHFLTNYLAPILPKP